MTTKIMVTGASGFIGHVLCKALLDKKLEVHGILRSPNVSKSKLISGIDYLSLGDIWAQSEWSTTLSAAFVDINAVIHCAARAHVVHENETDALSVYRTVNVGGTRNLAEQAAAAGVKRFIFLSSIKVNGEQTISGAPFTSKSNAFPEDAYGISKWEAEQALHEVSVKTGLEIVIIRPPLVYGPGVKGNFLSLLGWLNKGIPLPLGATHNQRSMVSIDNLIDLIITCIDHPAANDQTFLVSDDEDLSTTELLKRMSAALDKPARLLPAPSSLLQLGANLLGKKDVAQRLLGNLQVDISHTKEILSWAPPVSVDEGLRCTAEWYLKGNE